MLLLKDLLIGWKLRQSFFFVLFCFETESLSVPLDLLELTM